jgi:hypothetical protein
MSNNLAPASFCTVAPPHMFGIAENAGWRLAGPIQIKIAQGDTQSARTAIAARIPTGSAQPGGHSSTRSCSAPLPVRRDYRATRMGTGNARMISTW